MLSTRNYSCFTSRYWLIVCCNWLSTNTNIQLHVFSPYSCCFGAAHKLSLSLSSQNLRSQGIIVFLKSPNETPSQPDLSFVKPCSIKTFPSAVSWFKAFDWVFMILYILAMKSSSVFSSLSSTQRFYALLCAFIALHHVRYYSALRRISCKLASFGGP